MTCWSDSAPTGIENPGAPRWELRLQTVRSAAASNSWVCFRDNNKKRQRRRQSSDTTQRRVFTVRVWGSVVYLKRWHSAAFSRILVSKGDVCIYAKWCLTHSELHLTLGLIPSHRGFHLLCLIRLFLTECGLVECCCTTGNVDLLLTINKKSADKGVRIQNLETRHVLKISTHHILPCVVHLSLLMSLSCFCWCELCSTVQHFIMWCVKWLGSWIHLDQF